MIKLYGMDSPNVMKICLMLEELSLPYEMIYVNIWQHEQFAPEFVRLNPNSKVPVIVDPKASDGNPITVFESGAILYYLAIKTGRFLPKDAPAHFSTMQWLMLQMGSIGPMFGQSNHFRRSAPPGNEYAIHRYVTEVKRLFDVMEFRLKESEYLGCGECSVADLATFPWARYYNANGVDLTTLPSVKRWMNALEARAATQTVLSRWSEIEEVSKANRVAASEENRDRLYGRGRFDRFTPVPTS